MAAAPKRTKPCTPVCEVNNPDKHPFQVSVNFSLDAGMTIQNGIVIVPAGKRLVIEYISSQAFLPGGQKALFSFFCRAQDDGTWHHLPATASGRFGSQDCFECGHLVRLYADPGTGVALRTQRDSGVGTGTSTMSLSGHFVSV